MGKTEDEKKLRLDRVLALRIESERVEAELRAAVVEARSKRSNGERWASWAEVAEMLGMTAGGVQRRYRDVVPPERNRGRKPGPAKNTPAPAAEAAPVREFDSGKAARTDAASAAARRWFLEPYRSPEHDFERSLATYNEAAALIRAGYPEKLGIGDVAEYAEDLYGVLSASGTEPGARRWYTTEHSDGSLRGRMARSREEAIVFNAFTWGAVVSVTSDDLNGGIVQ